VKEEEWTIGQSKLVYGLDRNDLHFLDITEEGELCIRMGEETITFSEIVRRIKSDAGDSIGYTSSFTLRLPQLIISQVKRLKTAFDSAIKQLNYEGQFSAVYPVKVNQRRDFVLPVLAADPEYGLEVGTKSELVLVYKVIQNEKHRRIVCNGAKDPEYLDMIQKCIDNGYTMSMSVESLHEARLIVERFNPKMTDLVLRLKPYLTLEGHWSHSTGRDSKFGMSIHDIFDVIDLFKETGFLTSISTILGHAGSQIIDVESFRGFAQFMTRVFLELRDRGLSGLKMIDFGGGLPIDYTSAHRSDLMELYALSLVQGIKDVLEESQSQGISPHLLIESGRGITALGSLVLVRALELRSVFPPRQKYESKAKERIEREWLDRIAKSSSVEELTGLWNEFHKELTETSDTLRGILESEMLVGVLEAAVREKLKKHELNQLKSCSVSRSVWYPEHIAIGNFSVFNSVGDYVLVHQHFPIVPIRDLHVRPETTIRLVDITCDSDGEISQFHRKAAEELLFTMDNRALTLPEEGMEEGIPVGVLENVQGSYFVLALTGAYQDVIEMDHNLLGDLPDVELRLTEDAQWQVRWTKGAESIEHLLEDQGYTGMDFDEDPYMSASRGK
jgi:arginine decarboxylase